MDTFACITLRVTGAKIAGARVLELLRITARIQLGIQVRHCVIDFLQVTGMGIKQDGVPGMEVCRVPTMRGYASAKWPFTLSIGGRVLRSLELL